MTNISLKNLHIPDDVIVNNMLLNLPVKSLMRFKCVSRAWLDLITSSDFVESYNSRSRVSHRMLFCDAEKPSNLIVRDTKGDSSTIGLGNGHRCLFSNVCDGLVCVYEEWGNEVVVLNLTNRETRRVPCRLRGGSVKLGFDPITKRYKVVRLDFDYCKVLTLGPENTDYYWRSLWYPNITMHMRETISTYIEGRLSRFYSLSTRRHDEIAYFDLVSEEFGTIEVPEILLRTINYDNTLIIAYAGKPAIAINHADRLELWIYDNEAVIWSKETVELQKRDFDDLFSLWCSGISLRNLLLRFGNIKLCNCTKCKQVSIDQQVEHFLGIADINIAPLGLLFR